MFPLSWNAAYERQGLHGKRRIAHQLRFRWGIGLPYTESQPICGNFRAAGRGLLEAEYAGCPTGLRGVSFDGDFHAAVFALEKGFAGIFHNGNVRRRAFYGKLDWIGFAFAIAVAIIQPFVAANEVAGYCRSHMGAGSLRIGKMRSFDFVIVHDCRMCAKSRRVRHRRHFMRRI